MIEWPIYRNFSVFSQNSGYFDQNEKGVKKCPFPQSLRFCHNWWASGGVPGVRNAEELSALFYLHWESLWPGVNQLPVCMVLCCPVSVVVRCGARPGPFIYIIMILSAAGRIWAVLVRNPNDC